MDERKSGKAKPDRLVQRQKVVRLIKLGAPYAMAVTAIAKVIEEVLRLFA